MYRMIIVVMLACFALGACGGAKAEGDTTAEGEAEVDLTALQQLEGLATDLEAGLNELMQPINDVEIVVNDITSMPGRLGVDAGTLMGMAKATADSGEISISADLNLAAEAVAEVEAVLGKIKGIVEGLKATPERVKVLGAKATAAIAQVPVLAAAVTTGAQAKLANPLASAETTASAQADLNAVAGVQANVEGKIGEIQAQVTGLPALATEALAKLTASFAGGI